MILCGVLATPAAISSASAKAAARKPKPSSTVVVHLKFHRLPYDVGGAALVSGHYALLRLTGKDYGTMW